MSLSKEFDGTFTVLPYDQAGNNNYPGILSLAGSGSALFGANTSTFDSAFFKNSVTQISFNASHVVPFREIDPSHLFAGQPGGVAPALVPNIGPVNGQTGPDFQLQSDANSSFVVGTLGIHITKQTNGQTAPTPTGPVRMMVGTLTRGAYRAGSGSNARLSAPSR